MPQLKTRPILLLAAAAAGACVLAALLAGLAPLAGQYLDEALFRYPGSDRVVAEQVDISYLHRGWISWRAVYQTDADFSTTVLWYGAVAPSARTRNLGGCVAMRQSGAILTRPSTVEVLVCPLPPGTRIMVQEDVYLWP